MLLYFEVNGQRENMNLEKKPTERYIRQRRTVASRLGGREQSTRCGW